MTPRTHVSHLVGLPVVSFDEGLRLGRVQDVCIDRKARGIHGIVFKHGVMGAENKGYIDLAGILRLGRDVVIVSSIEAMAPIDERAADCLKHLKGLKITTREGVYLGELADLQVNRDDGRISAIRLDGNRLLPVDLEDIAIGPDVIVVPAGYAERMHEVEPEPGRMERVLDPAAVSEALHNTVDDIKASIGSGRKPEKLMETLKSGSEITQELVRRTSQKLRDTLTHLRHRQAADGAGAVQEGAGDQGVEAEHAGKTYDAPGPQPDPEASAACEDEAAKEVDERCP